MRETPTPVYVAALAERIRIWDADGLRRSGSEGWEHRVNYRKRKHIPAALRRLEAEGWAPITAT